MSQYNFMKSGKDLSMDKKPVIDKELVENITAITINYMDNALISADTYRNHCNRNTVLEEDIKRALMMEVYLMSRRENTLEKCNKIKEVIKDILEEEISDEEEYENEEENEKEDEFTESNCECGICKFMNIIHDKWKTFTPKTTMEKILHEHIENF